MALRRFTRQLCFYSVLLSCDGKRTQFADWQVGKKTNTRLPTISEDRTAGHRSMPLSSDAGLARLGLGQTQAIPHQSRRRLAHWSKSFALQRIFRGLNRRRLGLAAQNLRGFAFGRFGQVLAIASL